jgi:hypothetical protein
VKVTRIAFSRRLNTGKYAAEDLTKTFARPRMLGKNTNRRLAAWTKGVTAEALHSVSQRRGSVLVHVNAAINILRRAADRDIGLHTPYRTVKQILQERADRHRTRLPVQDSSPGRRAESELSDLLGNEL